MGHCFDFPSKLRYHRGEFPPGETPDAFPSFPCGLVLSAARLVSAHEREFLVQRELFDGIAGEYSGEVAAPGGSTSDGRSKALEAPRCLPLTYDAGIPVRSH